MQGCVKPLGPRNDSLFLSRGTKTRDPSTPTEQLERERSLLPKLLFARIKQYSSSAVFYKLKEQLQNTRKLSGAWPQPGVASAEQHRVITIQQLNANISTKAGGCVLLRCWLCLKSSASCVSPRLSKAEDSSCALPEHVQHRFFLA